MTESPMTAEPPPPVPYGAVPYPSVSYPPPVPVVKPPRRRTLVWPVLVTILITGVVFGGGTFLAGFRAGHARAAARPTTVALPPASSVAIGDGSSLKGYIVKPADAASGMNVAGSAFGVETPAQFAKAYFATPADETARLTGMRLAVVVAADWVLPNGEVIGVNLLQFHDADGAAAFLISQKAGYQDDPMTSGTGPVDGLTNAYIFEQPTPDAQGDVHAFVIGQDGPLILDVAFFTTDSIDRAADIAAFKRQFAALTP